MSLDIATTKSAAVGRSKDETKEFITMTVSNQLFGISVYAVRDILAPQKITSIPLAPPEVAGSLNLRGRIVTAIDLRKRLHLPVTETQQAGPMSIVVEHEDDLYSLLVDGVGEVLDIPVANISHNPENLSSGWQEVSLGVYPLKGTLLIILDVNKLLQFVSSSAT